MQNRVWKIARVFIDNLLTYIYISRNYRRTVSVENFTRISLASLSSEYIYIHIVCRSLVDIESIRFETRRGKVSRIDENERLVERGEGE